MIIKKLFLCLLFFCLLGQWLSGQLMISQLFLMVWSLILSTHDLKSQSYPLWLWLVGSLLLLPFFPITATSLILFLFAILAELKPIGIGSGDFFYLSTLALTLSATEILWIIQLGSLLGILVLYARQKTRQSLAFVPLLFIGYLLVTELSLLI